MDLRPRADEGSTCIHCGVSVSDPFRERCGIYHVVGKTYYLCFDCAIFKFENDPVRAIKATYRAIYWQREYWQPESSDKRADILQDLRKTLAYRLSPETQAIEAANEATYNDATMEQWDKDKVAIKEYQRLRSLGERPAIPLMRGM